MPSNQGSKLKLGTIQSFISLTNAQLICFNPLNAELNPICHLLTLLGAHPIFHISRIRVKVLKFALKYTVHLKQINCAIVGLIKDWITSKCTVQI